jgi:hypothetical protein
MILASDGAVADKPVRTASESLDAGALPEQLPAVKRSAAHGRIRT